MRCYWFLLGHLAAAAEEDARVAALCWAQGGKQVCFCTTDVSMTVVMAGQGLMCASVMPVMMALMGQMGTDVGMALMCAVGTVRVGAVHAASVHAGWDVVSVLPLASSTGPATQLAAFSPRTAFQARVQLDPGPVTFWISVQQNVRGRRLFLHQLLAVQSSAARSHGRQARHVVLRGRKSGMFAGSQTAVSARHYRFARTRRVMVAVAVTVSRRVAVHVYFRSHLRGPVGSGAAVSTLSRTAAAPAVPNIVPFSAVMDENEEAQGDGEGTIKAAEDHVQEVALRHSQGPKGPGRQEEEKGEGRCS